MSEKTYTIEQIRTYLGSRDSFGDVLYFLKDIDKILEEIEQTKAEEYDIKQDEFYK